VTTAESPHDQIHSVALAYIRKYATNAAKWRFTHLDAPPERLTRIIPLDLPERPLVTCFIDGQSWFAMTTSRVFGILRGSRFSFAPLEVAQWRWGDSKRNGRSEVETATVALTSGTHIKVAYETGPAATAPICYQRFWTTLYPTLDTLT
jgi:hypothetical protein